MAVSSRTGHRRGSKRLKIHFLSQTLSKDLLHTPLPPTGFAAIRDIKNVDKIPVLSGLIGERGKS